LRKLRPYGERCVKRRDKQGERGHNKPGRG
jgi:hypothetical protein